jgi:hypothetical protein
LQICKYQVGSCKKQHYYHFVLTFLTADQSVSGRRWISFLNGFSVSGNRSIFFWQGIHSFL